jgi:enoyl-CoA hydratase
VSRINITELKIEGYIGFLILKNPPQNYLLEPEFIPLAELDHWITVNKLKGLVISGEGRHFSGGAYLDSVFDLAASGDQMEERMNRGKKLLEYINDLNIPVVAAIHGICFGGGLEIALTCHIRFCSENALFAFPESNQGLMPGLNGIQMLREKISFRDSLEMILGGDMINAEEALSLKIVDKVVKDEDPSSYATHFLRKITEGRDHKIINYVMEALRNASRLPAKEAMKIETWMFCDLARSEYLKRKSTQS